MVWSQSPEAAERRCQLSEPAFCREIEVAIEQRLGRVRAVDDRYSFALNQHLVRNFNPTGRVLLMGDAARVLHPLAGVVDEVEFLSVTALERGFEDVRDFSARLAQLPAGADPGAGRVWKAFARQRRARAAVMLSLMTLLRRAYAEDDPYLQWLRSLGVSFTSRFGPLKKQIIREAMGLGPLAQSG